MKLKQTEFVIKTPSDLRKKHPGSCCSSTSGTKQRTIQGPEKMESLLKIQSNKSELGQEMNGEDPSIKT
jgi:hypothetical protein